MKQAKIFAHRGASGYAPENTLEAFALAQQQGADGIELDVQLSKDGVPVVFHDESLKRVSGHEGMIKDFTLEELKRIPVSNGFAQYSEARIPTLEEVLNLVKPGPMEINIELKTGIFWYPEIEEKTLELVKKAGMEDRIIYSSFNHYSVQKIRQLAPEAETAYLLGDVILHAEEYARGTGVKGLHPALYHAHMADLLAEYCGSGLAVRVGTVSEEDQIRWLLERGVDAVITNYPDRGVKVRSEAGSSLTKC